MKKDKEKFTVIIRIKPTNSEDKDLYSAKQMENTLKWKSNLISINKRSFQDRVYSFSHIFNQQSQQTVYEEAQHLIHELFEGYNATFLAYGQTGTGKTHTVFGSKQAVIESSYKHSDAGIFYRAAWTLFEEIHRRMNERQFSVRISFIEFYMDNVYDLLSDEVSEDPRLNRKEPRKLELKDTPKDGVIVKDLTEVVVKSYQQLINAVKKAIKVRRTEATSINQKSSRSHAVIQIILLQRWNVTDSNGDMQTIYRKGTLRIVDLAGSQRVSKTQSEGTRLEEAKRINKEITTLGKCISSLVSLEKSQNSKVELSDKFSLNKVHVPFRDCKLTRYLTDSLEGKCKIVLCVCISPFSVHSQQTFSSLLFANQASTLKVDAKRNQQFIKDQPRTVSPLNSNINRQSFETPSKLRIKTDVKEQLNLFKNTSSTSDVDVQSLNNIRTDIRLIDDQINGKYEEMDLSSMPRSILEKTLRTYMQVVRDLQTQLQSVTGRLQQERKGGRY